MNITNSNHIATFHLPTAPSYTPSLSNQSLSPVQSTLSNQLPSTIPAIGSSSIPTDSNSTAVLGPSSLGPEIDLSHPFGVLIPCRHGGCWGREHGVACNACLLQGVRNPYLPLIPLGRLPSRNPGGRRGLPLILAERLGFLYCCLRHEQTYCQLQRDKNFNKSTISRIVKDPKVKKWLARVLVVYPEDESFYRWLRIILRPCTTPYDPRKPRTSRIPKDSKAFKKFKKPKRSRYSNESLYQEWWNFISTD
ncbi:MAG: hypothetical protein J3Q66DRAFT_365807 [Benniella sp.]|nr:MAG: hypothetical protein J3Q66DRAFT_365807 [Benniella sp.]